MWHNNLIIIKKSCLNYCSLCTCLQVPDKDFPVLLQYLEGLQGKSRATTLEHAEKIIQATEQDSDGNYLYFLRLTMQNVTANFVSQQLRYPIIQGQKFAFLNNNQNGSIPMHVLPAKHRMWLQRKAWLPKKCDCRRDKP